MYFLHAINSDRQTRLLNVLGQIAMILGDKQKMSCQPFIPSGGDFEILGVGPERPVAACWE